MAKLAAIVLICISLASAKLSSISYPDLDNSLYVYGLPEAEVGHVINSNANQNGGIVWVMDLNSDLNSVYLRKGTVDEEMEFDEFMEPRRASLEKKLQSTTRRDAAVDLDSVDVKALQSDILRNVNKFVMSIREETDAYLSESITDEEVPSLSFFIKGGLTLLTVTSGRQQWHYVIGPPSPLPAWLHAPHPARDSLQIPAGVKPDLYRALGKLFVKLNSHPV